MQSRRDNPKLELSFAISRDGLVAGATARVSLSRNQVPDSWLDFESSPKLFKLAGWTNRFLTLPESGVNPGHYQGFLDMTTVTLDDNTASVKPLFEVTAPASAIGGVLGEEIYFEDVVIPMTAALSLSEHTTTQTQVGSLGSDLSSMRADLQRQETGNIATRVFYAVSSIDTGTRKVPAGAVSHIAFETRVINGTFTGTPNWYVWFTYVDADGDATDSAASSWIPTNRPTAPTDGTFTSEPYPS